jgi:putative ABC transport system permease protein
MELLIAFRNFIKRPFLNLIKTAGLGLALTGILLILLYIKSEISFDRFHDNSERIFRLTVTNKVNFDGKHFARVYIPDFVPAMAEYFSEIENYVRLVPVRGGVVKYNENFIRINQAFQCDSTFLQVFDVVLLAGTSDKVLCNPANMVISESFARKVFGQVNPVGRTLTLPSGQFYGKNTDFTITGVMRDFPYNSHFHPEFIATPINKDEFTGWAWTYLLLNPGSYPDAITKGFAKFYSLHSPDEDIETMVQGHVQPIDQIHLYSDKLREIEQNGNLFVIFTLIAAGIILLFISLINYINLNLGMAAFSDRYLHISKVFGSPRFIRVKFHFVEGLIILVASVAISIIGLSLSHFLLLKYFSLDLLKGNWSFIGIIIALFGCLCLLFSLLPLLKPQISRLHQGSLLKVNVNMHRKGMSKSLIVIQYAISTALIISVIVMMRQMSFALKISMGEDTGELICFEDLHSDIQSEFDIFKQELLKYHSVRAVTAMLDPPGGEANDMFAFELEDYDGYDEENERFIGILPCDYSFAKVFRLRFLSGVDFSPVNKDHEGAGEYILNETAMKKLGFGNPDMLIGKSFKLFFDGENNKIPAGKIIGVIEDFQLSGAKKLVEPLVLFKRKDVWLINFVVSAEPGMQSKAISDIEQLWKKLFPEHPFEYRLVNDIYRHVYKAELLQSKLLSLFTLVSLLISSMGLLGLSLLTTQRRTKEIGIRVVNGATIGEILTMLNWYFIKWILISFIIAAPLAWYGMNKWLENFAYKTTLKGWIFLVAGLLTLFIVLVTVSLQSWKAASRNPVEALRYE